MTGLAPSRIRHQLCQIMRKRERRVELKAKRASEGIFEKPRDPRPEFKSLAQREHYVRSDTPACERSPRIVECEACCDMPWARSEARLDRNFDPIGVKDAGGVVRCRGCNEPYAAERPPERSNPLVSSAGMAARHGQLHGANGASCSGKPSRKQFS